MSLPTPLNVLIFNDSLDVLETLRHAFVAHGHRVETVQLSLVRNASEVPREMVEKHRPDVIVFDVGIPYQSNWDFLEALHLTNALDGVPVVVTTANKAMLNRLVGPTDALEMAGLQQDLDAIRVAAETAARAHL